MITLPPFYPILDTAALERRQYPLLLAAEALLEAGARLLQLRHKGSFTRKMFEQAEYAARLCRHFGASLIVNDRADIAMMLDAGLHVGQDDIAPQHARRLLGERRVIGFSTHNADQLRAAAGEPVDYVALGPIFATSSKPAPDPVVGLEGLRRWRPLAPQPLVAIGGIRIENAGQVLEAGADSVAVIGDLLPEELNKKTLRERVERWLLLARPPTPVS